MPWQLNGVSLEAVDALVYLTHLSNHSSGNITNDNPDAWRRLRLGNDLRFWSNASKVVLEILAGQHYLPSLRPDDMGRIVSSWQTSLLDARIEKQVGHLVRILPPVCRAYDIDMISEAPPADLLVEHFLSTMVDVMIREWAGDLLPPYTGAPVSVWMYGLLTEQRQMPLGPQAAHQLYRDWRSWTEQLHASSDANFRICFALTEPGVKDPLVEHFASEDAEGVEALYYEDSNGSEYVDTIDLDSADLDSADSDERSTTEPASSNAWRLRYYLQSRDNATILISAQDVWETQDTALRIGNQRLDRPQERLLAGLGVASKLFPPIADSMRSPRPEGAVLTSGEAYHFLREIGPLLEASGFGLLLPEWWSGRRHARLGLRLRLLAGREDQEDLWEDDVASDRADSVRYAWELTLGGNRLNEDEFEHLVGLQTPLVNMHDRWVELDPEQIESAKRFLQRQSSGSMTFLQSLRMAQGHMGRAEILDELAAAPSAGPDLLLAESSELIDEMPTTLPLESVDVEGWLQVVLGQLRDQEPPEELTEPAGFKGSLRPYQRRGVGWLNYLRQLGIGACLADDMGLGKTIQALALLLYVRERHAAKNSGNGTRVAPTLLICPTSVVANWKHEIDRFAPSLRALIHHGIDRLGGQEFLSAMAVHDLAITSFGTARRDIDLLEQVEWGDLILDEAQNIKNPRAKQTQAVRRIRAHNRIALTGTPVENQLAELWSIMEFLNPGYLGGFERFRKQFIVPIERYNDEERASKLRHLVQPFLLRRLKSDPTIIPDLPEKNEMVVYCSMTTEQAALYEQTVQQALDKLDRSSGIQRRGLVLGLLTKLKQICNHPAHFLRESEPLTGRSGKLDRLRAMLDEALSVGDRALIFTQFVEMGHLLKEHLQNTLGTEVLFLHGGTTAKQRDEMVQFFQTEDGPAVFVLSLRAGGSGLNLTSANHVFHYDRWWNPAVEDQATDRAFRIGQTRNVQVHKFVVSGTLEERINEMIESKQALAQSIVGSGEDWLTELDNDQLRDLLSLRSELL